MFGLSPHDSIYYLLLYIERILNWPSVTFFDKRKCDVIKAPENKKMVEAVSKPRTSSVDISNFKIILVNELDQSPDNLVLNVQI